MPASAQRASLQALHWFRWVLSTTHLPSALALQTYCRLRRMDLWKGMRPSKRPGSVRDREKAYLEKSRAPVAGEYAVVLSGRVVGADLAGHVVQDAT